MRHTVVCMLLLLMLAALPMQSFTEGQVTSVMTISMGGVVKTTLVAGIVHNISISLSQASDDVVLKAYLSSGFTTSNNTNNYSWSYSSGTWSDDLYDYFIKNESARYGNIFSFNIALNSQAVPGNWRFVTYVDGTEVGNRVVLVEKPVSGISMSAPTFYFNVIPYGTGFMSSWMEGNVSSPVYGYLTTKNIGNVPLTLQITFEGTGMFGTASSLSATNSTGTAFPQEQRQHYVSFQAQSWSPRKFTVKGFISGEPQLLMTPNTVSTIIAPRTTFDVVVTVARPGYDVYQMDGVSVQYKAFYYSGYKSKISMDLYLTGNKSVYLGHEMQNLTFNHFTTDVQNINDEILISLSDTVEQHVVVNVTCSSQPPWKQPSMIAYANFNLRLAETAGAGRFTSNVVVSAGSETESANPISASMMAIIVLVIVFIVIGIFIFNVYRKTEAERRKELEDKIRKKKEREKKQRRH